MLKFVDIELELLDFFAGVGGSIECNLLIMNWFKRKEKRSESKATDKQDGDAYTGLMLKWMESKSKPMLLSTVYRCVDLISDSLAVLPLITYSIDAEGFKTPMAHSDIYEILNLEPNEDMSRFVFFKTMMASVLLKGNAYAYIERDSKNKVTQLIYIPAENVSIEFIPDAEGIRRKRYRVTGFEFYNFSGLIDPQDMIHVLNFSYDAITGVSTLSHARQTLSIASDSEAHAQGFFKSGASTAGVLTIEGARLTKEQKAQNYQEWENRTNPITGKPNGIVILEGNQKYQPISVSPKDSQLLESRQFNVVDICRFFSVSPVKAFDLSKSSYSTIEASQIEYLNDTVLPIVVKFENEINRKVFLKRERRFTKAEFNVQEMLRTDKASQASYWSTLFGMGVASPNQIKRDLNLPKIKDGDHHFVQVNVQTLDNAVKEKIDGTEQGQDRTQTAIS